MTIAYLYHPDCLQHDMGVGHPECADRLTAIHEKIKDVHNYEAPLATHEQLGRVHTAHYIDKILTHTEGTIYLDPDSLLTPQTPQAALRAAGALVSATDLVLSDQYHAAFCNIRPPGHHALADHAMGFCFFNNIAVGVAHAIAQYGLQRVAIVDFDVHHGNGTESIFKNETRVMLCSSFQHPFYPGVGADTCSDHIINIPLSAGTTGAQFRHAITTDCLPALHQFAPQIIYISAGFDGHENDDISMMRLHADDYAWITQEIVSIAQQYAQGRIISTLEGGYHLESLAESVAAHLQVLTKADN
ncbi:MAG: histone deacetylase family protein [Thiomargarita sp.]|nr:histone deacetylase family protein [Thiomargarita sp.]